jgi:hypothetical protein
MKPFETAAYRGVILSHRSVPGPAPISDLKTLISSQSRQN